MNIQKQNQSIYDLWIKQINLQYNARSNKPCIRFQNKPIFLCFPSGCRCCRDSGPFLHPLRPNDWRACVFCHSSGFTCTPKKQLLDVLSMCLTCSTSIFNHQEVQPFQLIILKRCFLGDYVRLGPARLQGGPADAFMICSKPMNLQQERSMCQWKPSLTSIATD